MNKFKISPVSLALRGGTSSRRKSYHLRTCISLLLISGLALIHAPTPSAAPLPASAPEVRLNFDTEYVQGSYDARWDISKPRTAVIKTEYGTLTYTFTMPTLIDPAGKPCKLTAKAEANKGARLTATIDLDGEVEAEDVAKSGSRGFSITAEPGETKTGTIELEIKPRKGYSEGALPLVRVKMLGGEMGLVKVFRYTVE
jgi:hypothetical protein